MRKPLHIMIDGCDSVGKSTACELLSKALGIPISRMAKAKEVFTIKKTSNIELLSYVYNQTLVDMKKYDFIIDRGYTSSLVYSKVYERNPKEVAYIDKIEEELEPEVFILINKNIDQLISRGDEVVPTDHFAYIQSTYEELANDRGYSVINVTDLTPHKVYARILIKLRENGWSI